MFVSEEFRASRETDIDYVIACGALISVRKADIAASHNYGFALRYFYAIKINLAREHLPTRVVEFTSARRGEPYGPRSVRLNTNRMFDGR